MIGRLHAAFGVREKRTFQMNADGTCMARRQAVARSTFASPSSA